MSVLTRLDCCLATTTQRRAELLYLQIVFRALSQAKLLYNVEWHLVAVALQELLKNFWGWVGSPVGHIPQQLSLSTPPWLKLRKLCFNTVLQD